MGIRHARMRMHMHMDVDMGMDKCLRAIKRPGHVCHACWGTCMWLRTSLRFDMHAHVHALVLVLVPAAALVVRAAAPVARVLAAAPVPPVLAVPFDRLGVRRLGRLD